MLETLEVDTEKIRQALLNLRLLYVTDMRYLEECSGSVSFYLYSSVKKVFDRADLSEQD